MKTQDGASTRDRQIVIVSNRLPAKRRGRNDPVGGLVAALEPSLASTSALWIGWSGKTAKGERTQGLPFVQVDASAKMARAALDLTEHAAEHYYRRFCNGGLWPLLHGLSERALWEDVAFDAYRDVNEAFADVIVRLTDPETPVWVHDYHLFLVAQGLRARRHRGRIGLFLHVPFPSADVLETLPWAGALLRGLGHYDVVGLQTEGDAERYRACAVELSGASNAEGRLHFPGEGEDRPGQHVAAFPIGTTPEHFLPEKVRLPPATADDEVAGLVRQLGDRKLILGVDRLDYTKGIPERIRAYERMLQREPSLRRRVTFVQVAVPSRGDVPDYASLRRRVESDVARINGEHGDADWVPIRYLHRSYPRDALVRLYRAADVAWVTPLRDGMNLVAKEFVAAQLPETPGVLVLSRFAGAAHQLADGAILTHPHHPDGMARDLAAAISLPRDERVAMHGRALASVTSSDAHHWARTFLAALRGETDDGAHEPAGSDERGQGRRSEREASPRASSETHESHAN